MALSLVEAETVEYHRFVEFCDACREFRYIGLCYGAPGTYQTLLSMRSMRCRRAASCRRSVTR